MIATKKEFIDSVVDEAVKIQQIPAPTFDEKKRAEYVKKRFIEEGLQNVFIDSFHNVYSCRSGGGKGKAILISAHLDTVFPLETDLSVRNENSRIYGPGIGDNSLAVACLIGLQRILNILNIELPGDLYIIANSCEEGLGDLKGIREVIKTIGDKITAIVALEGSNGENLTYKGIGSKRYKVTVKSPGGHSWGDFGEESAVHLLVKLAAKLAALKVADSPKTTYNIGTINGGVSVNTIAEEANLLLDLRSESKESLMKLLEQVEMIFKSFSSANSTLDYEIVGDRPVGELDSENSLVSIAKQIFSKYGIHNPDISPSSTDVNLPLSLGIPSICVGLTEGGNIHRVNEYIEIEPFYKGFNRFVELIINISEKLNS